MHVITSPPLANNRLKSRRYTWGVELFIAFIFIGGTATTYTLVNLILEGL